jgi:hypothetical protein|tara:strand:- start:919 stop:1053 length:135 start_codon:yes stop_codon:yes gene_type:complete
MAATGAADPFDPYLMVVQPTVHADRIGIGIGIGIGTRPALMPDA